VSFRPKRARGSEATQWRNLLLSLQSAFVFAFVPHD
jgi:hypothetical protein